jgi:hypothetical protein
LAVEKIEKGFEILDRGLGPVNGPHL